MRARHEAGRSRNAVMRTRLRWRSPAGRKSLTTRARGAYGWMRGLITRVRRLPLGSARGGHCVERGRVIVGGKVTEMSLWIKRLKRENPRCEGGLRKKGECLMWDYLF